MKNILQPSPEQLHLTLMRAARAASDVLMHYYSGRGGSLNVREKMGAGLVSDADFESEQATIRVLRRARPDFGILTEETGVHEGKVPRGGSGKPRGRWIIDPLDGTTNYVHRFPVFCVSIGAEWDGKMIGGVIYQPVLDELFLALKGKGAFLNGTRLKVSRTRNLADGFLSTGFSYSRQKLLTSEVRAFARLSAVVSAVRRPGSAALDLAYTARGIFDGFWERNLSPWDVAAGSLLVEEAGGKVSDFKGNPFDPEAREILASNGVLHPSLRKMLVRSRN